MLFGQHDRVRLDDCLLLCLFCSFAAPNQNSMSRGNSCVFFHSICRSTIISAVFKYILITFAWISWLSNWDWDRNCDTLDLAVGAPFMDGISGDNDYYKSGVVFLITVDASTGNALGLVVLHDMISFSSRIT